MQPKDPFPSSDFDSWAESYDRDVAALDVFPFAGYTRVLDTVVSWAAAEPGMSVLDLGTGTGNLARRFADLGCSLWCTDFSDAMLQQARRKLPPSARLVRHDLGSPWPCEFDRRFDRIVSAYVFHHFELHHKVSLAEALTSQRLAEGGRLIIADISFPDRPTMDRFAESIGDLWEEEPYWLADESMRALRASPLNVDYRQISECAGVYRIEHAADLRSQN